MLDRAKRIWYLLPMRAAKVQASLRIRAVSPEPSLFAHTSSESRGTFRQKNRSLSPLNGWACAVEVCHDEMLEDTNSLDGAHVNQTSSRGELAIYTLLCLTSGKEVREILLVMHYGDLRISHEINVDKYALCSRKTYLYVHSSHVVFWTWHRN